MPVKLTVGMSPFVFEAITYIREASLMSAFTLRQSYVPFSDSAVFC